VGFAELLFAGGSQDGPPQTPMHQQHVAAWGSGASAQIENGEVGGWELEPQDDIPGWLKASVFFGGSLVAGAVLAHLTGEALWQKPSRTPAAPPPAVAPPVPAKPTGTIITPGTAKGPG
jgi:hypothetical protein